MCQHKPNILFIVIRFYLPEIIKFFIPVLPTRNLTTAVMQRSILRLFCLWQKKELRKAKYVYASTVNRFSFLSYTKKNNYAFKLLVWGPMIFIAIGAKLFGQHYESFLFLNDVMINEEVVGHFFAVNLISSKVVAIGECGLDYDRLHFCPPEIQKKYVPSSDLAFWGLIFKHLAYFLLIFSNVVLFPLMLHLEVWVERSGGEPLRVFMCACDIIFLFLKSLFCTYHALVANSVFEIVKFRYFEKQFQLAYATKLPMFLHMRAAAEDFCGILEQNKHR